MSNYTPIIDYKGDLSFKTISKLIAQMKVKRDEFEIDMVAYKKIVSLMIEILENSFKYSDYYSYYIQDHPESEPVFLLMRNDLDYTIHSSNPILEKDIDKIKNKIDKINELNYEELRLFYRETMTNGEFTMKGGAGLGFIEMAKISCNKLQYNFKPLSGMFFNFELNLHVDKEKEN